MGVCVIYICMYVCMHAVVPVCVCVTECVCWLYVQFCVFGCVCLWLHVFVVDVVVSISGCVFMCMF